MEMNKEGAAIKKHGSCLMILVTFNLSLIQICSDMK